MGTRNAATGVKLEHPGTTIVLGIARGPIRRHAMGTVFPVLDDRPFTMADCCLQFAGRVQSADLAAGLIAAGID